MSSVLWLMIASVSSQTIVFRDDFNGNLDAAKWNVIHRVSEAPGELQDFIPENVATDNGFLNITSKKESYEGKDYTSGRVDTQNKFDFQYGEVEVRAKVPRGRGVWTAFSLIDYRCPPVVGCDYWPPSVSIVDIRGDLTKQLSMAVFFKGGQSNYVSQMYNSPADFADDFHVFKLLWTEDQLSWFVDDQQVLRVNDTDKIPKSPMQLVLDVAVGGAFPGPPDNTTSFPTYLLVDYVQIKQVAQKVNVLGPLLGSILGILFAALVVFLIWYAVRRRRRFFHGLDTMRKFSDEDSLSLANISPPMSIDLARNPELAKYVSLVEVPQANLQISEEILGSGEFGIVYKAVVRGLRGQPRPTVVAVKFPLPSSNPDVRTQFLEEMKIMTKVGRHLNIVNLLGVVCKGRCMLILEYCQFGSLLSYLKTHRGAYFYNHVDSEGHLLAFDQSEQDTLEKETAAMHRRTSFPEEHFDEKILSSEDLIHFCYQVARGMEYLAAQRIIHRDLAARNVLMCEGKILKISDFGLARQREAEYQSVATDALPVKWMPPESITNKTYSQKSDVWSYGILMTEIFSLGETPFAGSGVGAYVAEFVAWLQKGTVMERPSGAPVEMYVIMKKCWNLNAAQRPNFRELRLDLQRFVHEDTYLELDMPYQTFNQEYQKVLPDVQVDLDAKPEQVLEELKGVPSLAVE